MTFTFTHTAGFCLPRQGCRDSIGVCSVLIKMLVHTPICHQSHLPLSFKPTKNNGSDESAKLTTVRRDVNVGQALAQSDSVLFLSHQIEMIARNMLLLSFLTLHMDQ